MPSIETTYIILSLVLGVIFYTALLLKSRKKIITGIIYLIPMIMLFLSVLFFFSGTITGFSVYHGAQTSDVLYFNVLALIVFLFAILLVSARERKARQFAEIKAIKKEVTRNI